MPRKKRATSEEFVQLSFLREEPMVGRPSPEEDLRPGLCGHINRHYIGPGECVCTLPKGHSSYHEGDYVNSDGEKTRGAWSDAAGEPAEAKSK